MFLEADDELAVVGEARNGEEALRLARELSPDIVLMDLLMPVMNGVDATIAIRKDLPNTEVLALTSVSNERSIVGAMRAGAIGYVLKEVEGDTLRRSIKAAAAGQVQLSPQVAARLIGEIPGPAHIPALTSRETEVLRWLAAGESNKEIASRLFVSDETVKTHVSNILAKLEVLSRTQAALYAIRVGLIPSRE